MCDLGDIGCRNSPDRPCDVIICRRQAALASGDRVWTESGSILEPRGPGNFLPSLVQARVRAQTVLKTRSQWTYTIKI